MIAARATGHAVEDLSQRSDDTRVYANPDGTWTSDSAPGPEEVQGGNDAWHDIDTTLVPTNGGFKPKWADSDLVVSTGGGNVFASMTVDGKQLDWRWPTNLPVPVIDGDTATYAGAVPGGGDLVVTATSTGFTHDIVLKKAPKAADTAAGASWELPVATHGDKLTATSVGGMEIKTASGVALLAAPQPLMWDSSTDNDGGPQVATVDTTVGTTVSGTPSMTLAPDSDFLTDPSTVYPVTIDPSFTAVTSADTWVENTDLTSSQSTDVGLTVGTKDGGTHKARAFLKFPTKTSDGKQAPWVGKTIKSASLVLNNISSPSCKTSDIRVLPISEDWNVGTLTWANEPAANGVPASYSEAHGGGSACPPFPATWDVTPFVQAWADNTANNHGLRVKAADETDSNSWRRYRSLDYGDNDVAPRLVITYNRPPNTAGVAVVTPGSPGYSTSSTPTFASVVSDPDKGQVRGTFEVFQGSTLVRSVAAQNYVTNGGTSTVTWPAPLADGAYTVKVLADDETDPAVAESAPKAFIVDTVKPTLDVTATGFINGRWTATAPSNNTFTLSGSADTKSFAVTEDGVTQPPTTATGSGNATISWDPSNGAHELTVSATDKAGNTSDTVVFDFGVGAPSFPDLSKVTESTGAFPIRAAGPPGASAVDFTWRYADVGAWKPVEGVTTVDGSAWTSTDVTDNSATGSAETPSLVWDASTQEDPTSPDGATISSPALLQLRACFTYSAGQTCSVTQYLKLVPSAFDGNFPTAQMGPATVALFTGEASYSEADAVDAAADLGRTFTTFDPATITGGAFGPGWSTDLVAGADTGASLLDDRAQDHTFVLVSAGDSSQTFVPVDANVDPNTATTPVDFKPAGVDDGSRLVLDGNTVTLTRPGSTVTTWTYNSDIGGWLVHSAASDQANAGTPEVSAEFNNAGYPTWLSQTAPGDSDTCTQTTQEAGCRGLKFNYVGTGSDERVASIDRIAANVDPERLATYSYDANGLLASVSSGDPDGNGPELPLTTSYTYDVTSVQGRTLLKTVTSSGQAPWTFDYDTLGRLVHVTRPLDPTDSSTGSGTATWTVDYNLSVTADGLPDLSAAAASQWGQTVVPTHVYAVFDPSHVPADTPSNDDLAYAELLYTDEDGTTTNNAIHGNADGSGGSQWLIDTDWYDEYGNVTRTLDAAGRAEALLITDPTKRPGAALDASSITDYSSDGTRVEDEYGPVHTATLQDGTVGDYRAHTSYIYDDEAPMLGGADKPDYDTADGETSFDLAVETDSSAADPDMSSDHDIQSTRYSYSPLVAGDGNGWDLGTPTQTSVRQPDGTWVVVNTTRYDSDGNQIETHQFAGAANADGSGGDAHTTATTYYAKNAGDPDCNITGRADRAGWEGLVCKTGPAKQPSGPAEQPSGTPVPITWNKQYSADLLPTVIVGMSGAATRTTTTTYDNIGRITSTSVNDGTDTRTENVGYDNVTGLQTTTSGTGASTAAAFDTWGRLQAYTDGSGQQSTATYTAASDIATTSDVNGLTSYAYDQPDGEHRDVMSSMTVTPSGAAAASTFVLNYDAGGAQTSITYPNGEVATATYDGAGEETGLDYTAPDGTELLSFTDTLDVNGFLVAAAGPESEQAYTYDSLGRLSTVEDTRDGGCQTRSYGFDSASNRTSVTAYAAAADGGCEQSSITSAKTWGYDDHGRDTNAGYQYDNFGRATTIPAADTSAASDPNAGPLAVSYYANDTVASLTQTTSDAAGAAKTNEVAYSLDATDRIASITNSTNGAETSRIKYQYSDSSDAPDAVATSTDGGATWNTTGYINLPGVGMVASLNSGKLTYQLFNPHGDTVAQVSDPTGETIDSYSETDEYGVAIDPSVARYGYLGSAQRSGDTLGGLILMGARLYNPASGQFLTPDPILAGNSTPYSYPQDPVNNSDPSGNTSISLGAALHALKKVFTSTISLAKKAALAVWDGAKDAASKAVAGVKKFGRGVAAASKAVAGWVGKNWKAIGLFALNTALSSVAVDFCGAAADVCKILVAGLVGFMFTLLSDELFTHPRIRIGVALTAALANGYAAGMAEMLGYTEIHSSKLKWLAKFGAWSVGKLRAIGVARWFLQKFTIGINYLGDQFVNECDNCTPY